MRDTAAYSAGYMVGQLLGLAILILLIVLVVKGIKALIRRSKAKRENKKG